VTRRDPGCGCSLDVRECGGGSVTLIHGDCRDALHHVNDGREMSIDAVITDPPYGIAGGSAFVRNGGATVAECGEDEFNALVPEDEWMPQAVLLLRDGGYFATFCDTRRIRETEDALTDCGLTLWRRFYVINQAPPPTPRPTFMSGVQECVIAFKGTREWYGGGSTPNFWYGLPATRGNQSTHPAEKPLDAMVQLVSALVQPGGVVLDPFAGSGTTLRAAQLTGRRAIGIEKDRAYFEAAAQRLSQAVRSPEHQPVLF
jgi:site-specific DNA-methyltransferase (adenine-specific)